MPRSELARGETTRATSAAESRYRITAPNSLPRTVRIIGVDSGTDPVVADLATMPWGNAMFLRASADGSLRDLRGTQCEPDDAFDRVDLVVVVATAGEDERAAAAVGAACHSRGITSTALILRGSHDADPGRALTALQPYCVMVVATTSAECFADLLTALRA